MPRASAGWLAIPCPGGTICSSTQETRDWDSGGRSREAGEGADPPPHPAEVTSYVSISPWAVGSGAEGLDVNHFLGPLRREDRVSFFLPPLFVVTSVMPALG